MGVAAGPWYVDDTLTFTVNTHDVATGVGTDADAVPTYRIYEDETGTAILNGSTAKLDDANTVGFYSEQLTLSAANGFEVGKSYSIYVAATVDSVAATQSYNFKVIALLATAAALTTVEGKIDIIDTVADAIKLKTDGLPSDPADASVVAGLIAAVETKVDIVDTVADAIKLKTDGLPSDPADASVVAGLIAAMEAKIDIIDTTADAILADTDDIGVAGAGLTAIPWNSAWDAEVQSEATDALNAYDPPTRAEATTDVNSVLTAVDALPTNAELATALSTADDAVLAAIAALNNLSAAQVNAEMVDALSIDTYAEPGQATPAATASLATKINYLYKAWRNLRTQTATEFKLLNDDGVTVGQKAIVADDGTTFSQTEMVSGP